MIQNRETENFNNTWKPFVLLAEKFGELFWKGFKGTVLLFLFLSFFFVFYSVFASQPFSKYTDCIDFPKPSSRIDIPGEFSSTGANISGASKTNISHILFGIGGSVGTWKNRRQYSELWWESGVTRGFVWLDQKPEKNSWPDNSPPYRISEDTARFVGGTRSAVRIARILTESFRLGLENVRWFVMGDDDTVFFPANLAEVLAKYDHNQFYYIGGNSESVEQDLMHSYGMAFGGGGFAVSFPLAAAIARVFDGCLDRYANFYGSDQRVQACMSEIGVPLTREPGFHQIDVRGDAYGLLSAHPMAPLVSLHHLDYVNPLWPSLSQLDSLRLLVSAGKVDQARVLQQSFCYDRAHNWSVSVSWGYTVQVYPDILTPNVLQTPLQTFETWRSFSNEPFTFNTRPFGAEPCSQPVIFFLDGVKEEKGQISTTYQIHAAEGGTVACGSPNYPSSKLVTVRVRSQKMAFEEWLKAPRRQCCDVGRGRGEENFQVRIRSCGLWETISPS